MTAALRLTASDLAGSLCPASVFDGRLADKWRCNAVEVEESLRLIRQHGETIEQRHEMLRPGTPRHRPEYVAYARKMLAQRLRMYVEAVRLVSQAEAEMERIGMTFAKSSDHWSEVA